MKRLNNYQKMIKYLVKDIYRKDFKEDIEQELSLYLLNLLDNCSLKSVKNIDGYIYTCLKNKRNKLCSLKKYNTMLTINADDFASVEDNYTTEEFIFLKDKLDEFLTYALTAEDEKLIRIYYLEQMTMVEISKIYGISYQEISKRIRKIVTILRKKFNDFYNK